MLRIRRHDLFMYWGKGNSLSSFTAHTMVFLWGILALFNFAASGVIKTDASKVFSSTEIQSSDSTIKNLTPTTTPDVERKLTPEELQQLEVKMQYSGDDEIIRKRLGLPPKSTQVTNSLPDQQPTLEKNPKVDDPAPEAPKAEATSEWIFRIAKLWAGKKFLINATRTVISDFNMDEKSTSTQIF